MFFFQAEDGIRDLVRSRGLGDVYKRQETLATLDLCLSCKACKAECPSNVDVARLKAEYMACLLYTSDAADERSSVDLGGRRIIKKKKKRGVPAGANIGPNQERYSRHRNAREWTVMRKTER